MIATSVGGWSSGWRVVTIRSVDRFSGLVPLRLFGVDIYVEPRAETVRHKDGRSGRCCRNKSPFLVLFIPLSLPALRHLPDMSANARGPICSRTCTMSAILFTWGILPLEEAGRMVEGNQPLELV
jgi:hypothetical protein